MKLMVLCKVRCDRGNSRVYLLLQILVWDFGKDMQEKLFSQYQIARKGEKNEKTF